LTDAITANVASPINSRMIFLQLLHSKFFFDGYRLVRDLHQDERPCRDKVGPT